MLPSPDAIAEFKVQSNLLPAEFGRALGGAINISLRSGTNGFHGTMFHFLRNANLDANNFFNAGRDKPPFQQNQFGGALGGPVYLPKLYNGRNRTFWFADYQGTRIRKGLTRLFTVPTAAMRSGRFYWAWRRYMIRIPPPMVPASCLPTIKFRATGSTP